MMDTFLANLRYAVRNKQSVEIGGGEFTPSELRQVLEAIETALEFEKAVIGECMKVEGCLNSNNPARTLACLIETNIKYSK